MRRRRLRLAAVLGSVLATAACGPASVVRDRAPNIVFILMDDLGTNDVGAFRAVDTEAAPRTPALDRLAAEGVRFTQFYAAAPSCSPTRISILTGRYPQRLNVRTALAVGRPWSNGRHSTLGLAPTPEVDTLPEMLDSRGYETFHVGKWHVGSARAKPDLGPRLAGFDHSAALIAEGHRGYCEGLVELSDGSQGAVETLDPPVHLTTWLVDHAISLLRRRTPESPPFFLNLWLQAPHRPWDHPDDCGDKERPKQPYRRLVEHADRQLGRLLTELDALGLGDDTVVVFTSDNGPHRVAASRHASAAGFRGTKGQLFEGGIRVPLIVRWRGGGVPAGTSSSYPAASIDFLPTLAELAGYADTASLGADGESFHDVLRNPAAAERPRRTPLFWETVYWSAETGPRAMPYYLGAVRRGRWKLRIEPRRLFDMSDPACQPGGDHSACENDARDASGREPQVAAELEAEYRHWRLETTEIPLRATSSGAVVSGRDEVLLGSCPGCSAELTFDRDRRMDFADGDFSFVLEVKPDGEVKAGARLAGQEGSWSLSVGAGGLVELWLSDQPYAGAEQQHAVLRSHLPLEPEQWNRVAFTVSGAPAGPCPCGDSPGSCRSPRWYCQEVRLYLQSTRGSDVVTARPVDSVGVSASTITLGSSSFRGAMRSVHAFVTALGEKEIDAL